MAQSKSTAKRLAVQKAPSLASQVDAYYSARESRLKLQREVDALEKAEKLLKNWLIDNIPKSEATGVAGQLARATIVRKDKPVVEDWALFYAYIKKTGNFDLMQRRLTETAVRERWEDNKEVPGVTKFPYVDVSINKV